MNNQKIKTKILDQLRDWRETEGNAYNGLPRLMEKLNLTCEAAELYDWDNECGIMWELEDEGHIMTIHGEKPCFLASGEMDWN